MAMDWYGFSNTLICQVRSGRSGYGLIWVRMYCFVGLLTWMRGGGVQRCFTGDIPPNLYRRIIGFIKVILTHLINNYIVFYCKLLSYMFYSKYPEMWYMACLLNLYLYALYILRLSCTSSTLPPPPPIRQRHLNDTFVYKQLQWLTCTLALEWMKIIH